MFGSDNQYGAHPLVMDAIMAANKGVLPSYGGDELTQKANKKIAEFFETDDLDIYFVATGGAANCLALASLCPNWGAIICHSHAHILLDEGNGVEMFTGGARLIGIGDGVKLSAEDLRHCLANHDESFVHAPQPKAISFTNLNENGLLHLSNEVQEFSSIANEFGLYLHCDGARICNAIVASNESAANLTWKSGVDALSFGLTKNGALLAEAVILFGRARNKATPYLRKSSQQLISKHRFMSAQFIAMLENDLWRICAQNANIRAQEIAKILEENKIPLSLSVKGNEIFACMDEERAQKLQDAGIGFYPWHALGKNCYRFVASWALTDNEINRLKSVI